MGWGGKRVKFQGSHCILHIETLCAHAMEQTAFVTGQGTWYRRLFLGYCVHNIIIIMLKQATVMDIESHNAYIVSSFTHVLVFELIQNQE